MHKNLAYILAVIFFIGFFNVKQSLAEEKKAQDAKQSQPSTQQQVPQENQPQVEKKESKTQQKIDKLEKKAEEIQNKLPQVTVKETVLQVKPDVHVYLPNGSMDLSLRQYIEKMTVDFNASYDLVDNKMGFGLDFLRNLGLWGLGLALNDNVDFQQVFSSNEYLQRVQSIAPYAKRPICKNTEIKFGFRFEDTYTTSLSSYSFIDKGKNIVAEATLTNSNVDQTKIVPTGGERILHFEQSIDEMGSDYKYTQAELQLKQFINTLENTHIEYLFQAGYPIYLALKPLTSLYYAGGYRMMKGYDYQEFSGNALLYNCATYNVPLAGERKEKLLGIAFSIVTWEFFVEGANIGEREIYTNFKNTKWDFGTGIGYTLVILKYFPVKFDVSMAKAFESRDPKFYFTISTIYYTWSNK